MLGVLDFQSVPHCYMTFGGVFNGEKTLCVKLVNHIRDNFVLGVGVIQQLGNGH